MYNHGLQRIARTTRPLKPAVRHEETKVKFA